MKFPSVSTKAPSTLRARKDTIRATIEDGVKRWIVVEVNSKRRKKRKYPGKLEKFTDLNSLISSPYRGKKRLLSVRERRRLSSFYFESHLVRSNLLPFANFVIVLHLLASSARYEQIGINYLLIRDSKLFVWNEAMEAATTLFRDLRVSFPLARFYFWRFFFRVTFPHSALWGFFRRVRAYYPINLTYDWLRIIINFRQEEKMSFRIHGNDRRGLVQ